MEQKVWSPDCQSYFVNHAVDYRLLKSLDHRTFSLSSLAQGEKSTMYATNERCFCLMNDPTERVRSRDPRALSDLLVDGLIRHQVVGFGKNTTERKGDSRARRNLPASVCGGGEVWKDSACSESVAFSPEQLRCLATSAKLKNRNRRHPRVSLRNRKSSSCRQVAIAESRFRFPSQAARSH